MMKPQSSANIPASQKVAVVTGAGSGIGFETCRQLRAAGWNVVGIDLNEGEGIHRADVTELDQLEAIAAGLAGARVDALLCIAGIWSQRDDRYTSVPLDVWNQTFAVNVTGTMLTMRAFAPLLAEGSSVVTIASMAALTGIPKRDAYTASKGAVIALTRAWAADLIRLGIRVNCVAPGVVETPMTASVRGEDEPALPLGRAASAAEVAAVITALTGEGMGYVSGAIIPIDGGITAANGLVTLAPRASIGVQA